MKDIPAEFDPKKRIPATKKDEIDYDTLNTEILLKSGFISKAVYDEIKEQLTKRREALHHGK